MKKIDAHSHIGVFGGWANVSITSKQLLNQMKLYDIEKVVLCSSSPKTNEETLKAYYEYPDAILPLVYLNPYDTNVIEIGEDYIKNKDFKGIKLNPLANAFVADSELCDPIMCLAKKFDVPVFIHCGHPPYSLPWSIALLAERHPHVKTVMIHMGHGHGVYIDASIKMAKKYPNLYLEMSGMPMESKIYEAYKTVGSDRIMFGIDAPFHHPSVEIQKVLMCGLTEKELEDIFYHNISKLMNLSNC